MVDHSSLSRVYQALGDPTRMTILSLLGGGEARISDLAAAFPHSLWAVSKHVRVLESAGIVVRRRAGRDHWLSLQPDRLKAASSWLEELRPFWEARIAALEGYLNDAGPDSSGAPPSA